MGDTEPVPKWSNRHFTRAAAVVMLVIGFFVMDSYSLTAAITVWSLAFAFLVGSFFIEKDLGRRRGARD
jgi:hypothetical protein